ncbi:hypothetical protein LTR78_002969 [Recurvomyces mirabilis]|uniref:Uncharacterized protein n=1 Tax=Recurvomyces mirabilis TaxID=574656 RepID=A0AAE0WSU5_9PEZI|nr:hypothetical protein LTR78_002969 [Recurvomyces mirabilis]KAK5159298.1 hypothetical protein LTS14_002440 [Recurvomyces mirabilis]
MAPSFSEKDQQFLTNVVQCFEGGSWPKIDYKKLAPLSGYKTPASATTAWHNLRKKLEAGQSRGEGEGEGEGEAAAKIEKTPAKKPGGRKRAVKSEEEEGEDEVANEASPKKRGRKAKVEVVVATAADEEGGDQEANAELEVEVKPVAGKKKGGRPPKKAAASKKDVSDEAVKTEQVDGEAEMREKAPAVEASKKKGGRPKKAAPAVAATTDNIKEEDKEADYNADTTDAAPATSIEKEKTPASEASTKRGRGRPAKMGGAAAGRGGNKIGTEVEGAKDAGDADVEAEAEAGEQVVEEAINGEVVVGTIEGEAAATEVAA